MLVQPFLPLAPRSRAGSIIHETKIVSGKESVGICLGHVIAEVGRLLTAKVNSHGQGHVANLRRALRPNGRVTFVCWRDPRENPWMTMPMQAVYQHVPKLPQLGPEDPGPFAFASEERVRRILGGAGYRDVALERCDLSIDIANGRGLEGALDTAMNIGPASDRELA